MNMALALCLHSVLALRRHFQLLPFLLPIALSPQNGERVSNFKRFWLPKILKKYTVLQEFVEYGFF